MQFLVIGLCNHTIDAKMADSEGMQKMLPETDTTNRKYAQQPLCARTSYSCNKFLLFIYTLLFVVRLYLNWTVVCLHHRHSFSETSPTCLWRTALIMMHYWTPLNWLRSWSIRWHGPCRSYCLNMCTHGSNMISYQSTRCSPTGGKVKVGWWGRGGGGGVWAPSREIYHEKQQPHFVRITFTFSF